MVLNPPTKSLFIQAKKAGMLKPTFWQD